MIGWILLDKYFQISKLLIDNGNYNNLSSGDDEMKYLLKSLAKALIFLFAFLLLCIFAHDFTFAKSSTAFPDTVYFEPAPGSRASANGDTFYIDPNGEDIKINMNLLNPNKIILIAADLKDFCYDGDIFLDTLKNDDSVSFENSRIEYWPHKIIHLFGHPPPPVIRLSLFHCNTGMPPVTCTTALEPGDGPIVTLTFTVVDTGCIYLDSLGGDDGWGVVVADSITGEIFIPDFIPGSFYVRHWYYTPGDFNCDVKIDIVDVVSLVNYLFRSGEEPCFMKSADANCDQEVTIADVVYLTNYIFRNGPAPQICDY